jgi:hypothetical protein
LKNVAYTSEYQNSRNKLDYIFCEKYLTDTEIIELSQEYSVKISNYEDSSGEVVPYRALCSAAFLLDKNSEIAYSIRNINNDGAFYNLIKHRNGNNYLVFRIDLYGYSVLDLCTMKIITISLRKASGAEKRSSGQEHITTVIQTSLLLRDVIGHAPTVYSLSIFLILSICHILCLT